MRELVYLSLGSNLGNREENLKHAIERLSSVGRLCAVSSFYETEPVEFKSQPWFLNCAVAMETEQTPDEFLSAILEIERDLGRRRSPAPAKGPRKIDIDILLFGDSMHATAQLTIPHPAMQERRFVLEPLAEIAPQVRHPRLNQTVRELLDLLPSGQTIRKLA